MSIADILGVLGFFLALGLGIWEINKERPKLKITHKFEFADFHFQEKADNLTFMVVPMCLHIFLSNTGEKPIAISRIQIHEENYWFSGHQRKKVADIFDLANEGEDASIPPFIALPGRWYPNTITGLMLIEHLNLSTSRKSTRIFITVQDETFRIYRSKKFRVTLAKLGLSLRTKMSDNSGEAVETPVLKEQNSSQEGF